MNKKYMAAILPILCALALWMSAGAAFGWGMPSQNEAEFLQWYEAHKEMGGEFTLSRMMTLKSGTADEPIILDGTGKIKINCGRGGDILIASPVIINNPNLEIVSEASSGIVMSSEEGDLRLINGSLEVYGDTGIFCLAGKLHCGYPSAAAFSASSPSEATPSVPTGRSRDTDTEEAGFCIVVRENQQGLPEGQIIAGIAYEARPAENEVRDLNLSSLYIEVSGRLSCGIYNRAGAVTADRCEITVSGSQMAYGIQAKGRISLSDSSVTAEGPAGSSLVSDSGMVDYDEDDSFAYGPEYENELPYVVTGLTEPLKSIAVRIHSDAEAVPFPEKVEMNLKNVRTSAGKTRRIAVEDWDTSLVSFDQTGIYYAEGSLSEESLLKASASNALDITAAQRVNVLDETGTFIDDILYDKGVQAEAGKTHFTVYCPRPEGAKALYVEYNRDGENWLLYEWRAGESSWLENRNVMQAYEPYDRLMLDITVPYDNGAVGVRLRTAGGVYEGIGRASTVNMNDGTVSDVWNEDSVDDGSGGDRGGGTVEPDLPVQKPDGDGAGSGSAGDSSGSFGGESGSLPGSGGNLSGDMNADTGENMQESDLFGGKYEENGRETAGIHVKSTELPAAAEKAEQAPDLAAKEAQQEGVKTKDAGTNHENAGSNANRADVQTQDKEITDDRQADTKQQNEPGVREEAASSSGSVSRNGRMLVKILTAVIVLVSALLVCACIIKLWIKKMA